MMPRTPFRTAAGLPPALILPALILLALAPQGCASGPNSRRAVAEGLPLPKADSARDQAGALRTRAIALLEQGYRTVQVGPSRRFFDLAIRDLERARDIYFRILRDLPAHAQAPVEGDIEQVQLLLRRAVAERPQRPIR